MNQDSTVSKMAWIIAGAALGAVAMYVMDPDKGNRRRALVRDKMFSASLKARRCIDRKSRDMANRARGLVAETKHMMTSGRENMQGEKHTCSFCGH